MLFDVSLLYQGLQSGDARGSRLFEKIRMGEDRTSIEAKPLLRRHLQHLKAECDRLRDTAIPSLPYNLYRLFDVTGDRSQYEALYFDRRNRLLVFGLASWLWKKPEDLRNLEDTIWAICDEYTWCLPAHMGGASLNLQSEAANAVKLDLFACETGFALAECCAMLEDTLPPLVVQRARNEVHRRVFASYLENGELQHWELLKLNWCAVCAGSIGAAACYLIEDDRLLGGILYKLLPTLERFLDSFSGDGACTEGLTYWTYGISYFACIADMLFHRTNGAVNLLADSRIEKIAHFQQYCYFSGGNIVNFSDVRNTGFSPGLTSFFMKHFGGVIMPPANRICSINHDYIAHYGPALRDLLWTGSAEPVPFTPAPLAVFEQAQWLIGTQGDVSLAAKGGHNDEPHNHNDIGSFILYKKGTMVIADLGSGEYVEDYFNENRYTIFCNQSFSYSVPIVAEQGQKAGRQHRAEQCRFGPGCSISLDMAAAYDIPGLAALKRNITLENAVLRLEDNFEFDGKPLPVTERFITLIKPEVRGGAVYLAAEDSQTTLKPSLPLEPAISSREHRDGRGRTVTVYLIDFAVPGTNVVFEFT